MKKILELLLLSILCSNSFAEMYRVNVKRVDNNLYQTTDGRYVIKTNIVMNTLMVKMLF